MYPAGEHDRLSARKALVQVRIAQHRWQCVEAGAALARPLETIDGLVAKWRTVSPVAKLVGTPIAVLLARKLFRGGGRIASLVKVAPTIFQAVRTFTNWRAKTAAAREVSASSR